MTMLEFHKDTTKTTATIEDAKLRAKTEAYLVETIVQKLSDLYLARYGEQILANLDIDALVTQVQKQVTTQLVHENSNGRLRDD